MSSDLRFVQEPSSKLYNTSTNHPLIPNANDYIIYKKYVSIHSEDRDVIKYPNSNQFEIEMPEDITNIYSLRLINWTFPSNYNSFSQFSSNILLLFYISKPYNPGANMVFNPLEQAIFTALFESTNELFEFTIQEGFYNPTQMVTELQNKFNFVVTQRIKKYLIANSLTDLLTEFNDQGGYTKFIIVYNSVGQKIWYGNTSDEFIIANEAISLIDTLADNLFCASKAQLPEFDSWGLPANLGLSRCNTTSISIKDSATGEPFTPRFFYGDVNPGDNGFWLLPDPTLTGSVVYFIEPPYKINFMGPAYFYMELANNNCIDETSPYAVNKFTLTTNITNGITNAAFAKIGIPTTPISQWFDRESLPYKMYWPPADRMRKLNVKFRYHNGQLVNFGAFPYSFTIEFTTLLPNQPRRVNNVGVK
jgi:hypothetical protein